MLDTHGYAHHGASGAAAHGQDASGGLAVETPSSGWRGFRGKTRDELGAAAGSLVASGRARDSSPAYSADGEERAHRPESGDAELERRVSRRKKVGTRFHDDRAAKGWTGGPLRRRLAGRRREKDGRTGNDTPKSHRTRSRQSIIV